MKGGLIIGGGILIALLLARRAKSIKDTVKMLDYMPRGIDLKFEGLTPVLTLKIDVYNPNRTSVPVDGVVGKISYNGGTLATFSTNEKFSIDGTEAITIPVKVRLSLFNAIVTAFDNDHSKTVRIDGLVKCNYLADLPISWSYSFNQNKSVKNAVSGIGYASSRKAHRMRRFGLTHVQANRLDVFNTKNLNIQ